MAPKVTQRETVPRFNGRGAPSPLPAAATNAPPTRPRPCRTVVPEYRAQQLHHEASEFRTRRVGIAGRDGAWQANDVCAYRHHASAEPPRRAPIQSGSQRLALGAPETEERSVMKTIWIYVDTRYRVAITSRPSPIRKPRSGGSRKTIPRAWLSNMR